MADINSIVLPDGTEYPISDYYLPVAISNPTSGQVLKYDAENQVWYNGEDASGSSVLYGTSAPTSQLGTDGCLYVKYTEGTGGASDTVDALYVKLDGSWCQISTGGGGGTSDYSDLTNKPQINSVELSGNKSLDDLGIQPSEISKTATGSIVTFSDGGDNIPVESFECEIVAQQESGTPTPDNPLTITGFNSADIPVSGINIWDEEWEIGGIYYATGQINDAVVDRIRTKNFIPCSPSTTYYMKASNGYTLYCYDENHNFISRLLEPRSAPYSASFTTPINAKYLKIGFEVAYGTTYNNDFSINYPSTDTQYHPYTGTLYSIDFGQTIYGGKLIYANGKWFIRATHKYRNLGDSNWIEATTSGSNKRFSTTIGDFKRPPNISTKGNIISNRLVAITGVQSYSGTVTGIALSHNSSEVFVSGNEFQTYDTTTFKTLMQDYEVVYELATPVIIPLTSSAKIKTLPGVNNIFSNTGDSTLKYFTNDADGIEELINNSETSAENTTIDDTNLAYEADNVQEAFEKITKSLTWAEYQALSEEEKNNGTAYFITDVNGDGQNFQPIIYSEEDREIGVWIDGKPLYEKTIVANVTRNQFAIDVSDLNIDNVIVNDGFIVQTIGNVVYEPYASSQSDYALAYYNKNNNNIICAYAGAYNTTTWNIRIRYTKTTDAAGSGTWTPQGVPAVHYSTDEKIVGTWTDGSIIYEKSFPVTNVSMPTGWTNVGNMSGIKDFIDCKQCLKSSDNIYTYSNLPAYYMYTTGNISIYNGLGGTMGSITGYVTIRYTKTS